MICKICSHKSEKIFRHKVFLKYDIDYYRCSKCLFIQTEEPYWLDEAYRLGAIGALDVGIMSRNLMLIKETEKILDKIFPDLTDFIGVDYGGGQGIFVRMIRDLGFNFYRQDMYADNLYARYFDINDLPINTKFNILTAFEVFEHLPNPLEEIKKMFNYSDILLFSTELQPSNDLSEIERWWYLVPEGGQHVSFFNKITIQEIAKIFNANYYTNSKNLHILSKTIFPLNPFSIIEKKSKLKKNIIKRVLNILNNVLNSDKTEQSLYKKPKSLIMNDFEFVKQKIRTDGN